MDDADFEITALTLAEVDRVDPLWKAMVAHHREVAADAVAVVEANEGAVRMYEQTGVGP